MVNLESMKEKLLRLNNEYLASLNQDLVTDLTIINRPAYIYLINKKYSWLTYKYQKFAELLVIIIPRDHHRRVIFEYLLQIYSH